MRRAVQVTLSLLVVFALLGPFDCFAASQRSHEAADCCLKGKCVPKARADECCKNAAPDRDLLGPKSTNHRPAAPALALVAVPSQNPPLSVTPVNVSVEHPP